MQDVWKPATMARVIHLWEGFKIIVTNLNFRLHKFVAQISSSLSLAGMCNSMPEQVPVRTGTGSQTFIRVGVAEGIEMKAWIKWHSL